MKVSRLTRYLYKANYQSLNFIQKFLDRNVGVGSKLHYLAV